MRPQERFCQATKSQGICCYARVADDIKLVLVENYPCQNKYQAEEREHYWARRDGTLNDRGQSRPRAEAMKFKREQRRDRYENDESFREEAKTWQKNYRSQRVNCPHCHKEMRKGNLSQHITNWCPATASTRVPKQRGRPRLQDKAPEKKEEEPNQTPHTTPNQPSHKHQSTQTQPKPQPPPKSQPKPTQNTPKTIPKYQPPQQDKDFDAYIEEIAFQRRFKERQQAYYDEIVHCNFCHRSMNRGNYLGHIRKDGTCPGPSVPITTIHITQKEKDEKLRKFEEEMERLKQERRKRFEEEMRTTNQNWVLNYV